MTKLGELKGVAFDGKGMGYVPPAKLSISKKLRLHRKTRSSIDPVNYEVIRHALWHVNEEHGATIQRISGSPVAMYALDLNPSILTEDGAPRSLSPPRAGGRPDSAPPRHRRPQRACSRRPW